MRNKKYYPLALIQLSCFMLLCSVNTQAQTETEAPQSHERMYQVELIVFARNQVSAEEHWPSNIKLAYPDNLINLTADANSSEEFSILAPNARMLNLQANTLSKGSYSLLYHQAWRQMIYGRKTNIAISGGKKFNGHQELEGSIALSVGQFLRIQTNLWLTQFVPAGTNITHPAPTHPTPALKWPALPSMPNTSNSEGDKPNGYLINRIVKLNQERSMRSNEVHYIDHPLLGIIVKIVPVEMSDVKSN